MSSVIEGIMRGKKGLVIGVANERSIAWGIAKAISDAGASVAITYMSDIYKDKIKTIADKLNASFITKLNVSEPESMDSAFAKMEEQWGTIDFIVHAVAFSDKNELSGRYVNSSLDNFLQSMHISCYSFTDIAKRASKIMNKSGSILTISYYGAAKVIPNYNIMGVCKSALESSVRYLAADLGVDNIRVNAISAGPIRTLASSAIQDFHKILNSAKSASPLKRTVTIEEVGNSAVYLLSDMSTGVTGEIHYVDAGYNVVGMDNTCEEEKKINNNNVQ